MSQYETTGQINFAVRNESQLSFFFRQKKKKRHFSLGLFVPVN